MIAQPKPSRRITKIRLRRIAARMGVLVGFLGLLYGLAHVSGSI